MAEPSAYIRKVESSILSRPTKRGVMRVLLFALVLLLSVSATAQEGEFIEYDSLAFFLDGYGFTEYALPISGTYDTLIQDYTDTFFVWVTVDSALVDSAVAAQFFFVQPVKNMWVAHAKFYDQGIEEIRSYKDYDTSACTIVDVVDTVVVNKVQDAVILHVIPERSPTWINDLGVELVVP